MERARKERSMRLLSECDDNVLNAIGVAMDIVDTLSFAQRQQFIRGLASVFHMTVVPRRQLLAKPATGGSVVAAGAAGPSSQRQGVPRAPVKKDRPSKEAGPSEEGKRPASPKVKPSRKRRRKRAGSAGRKDAPKENPANKAPEMLVLKDQLRALKAHIILEAQKWPAAKLPSEHPMITKRDRLLEQISVLRRCFALNNLKIGEAATEFMGEQSQTPEAGSSAKRDDSDIVEIMKT